MQSDQTTTLPNACAGADETDTVKSFAPLLRICEEADDVLGRFDRRQFWNARGRTYDTGSQDAAATIGFLLPRVDVIDADDAAHLTADLPGMEVDDIKLSVRHGKVTPRGQNTDALEEGETRAKYYARERRCGSFQRNIRNPGSIDFDKIEADFRNGVLKNTMPKLPEAKQAVHRIAVTQST